MRKKDKFSGGSRPVEGEISRHSSELAWDLRRGKNRKLGILETIGLKLAGKADGKAGLPKDAGSGRWSSAFMAKEETSFAEYCDRLWGNQQIKLHSAHAQRDVAYAEILSLTARMALLTENAPQAVDFSFSRKQGEEELSQTQVEERRAREFSRERSAYLAEVDALEGELAERYKELELVHSYIQESDNAARLISQRVMDRCYQRLEVYWRAAYRVHPEASKMPASSGCVLSSQAEDTYFSKHIPGDSIISEMLFEYNAAKSGEMIKEVI